MKIAELESIFFIDSTLICLLYSSNTFSASLPQLSHQAWVLYKLRGENGLDKSPGR